MKQSSIVLLMVSFLGITASSCQAIASIFKAGMGFGIFLVVLVIVIIVAIVMRVSRKS